MLADLVVLNADPVASISATRRIHSVVRGGVAWVLVTLALVLGALHPRYAEAQYATRARIDAQPPIPTLGTPRSVPSATRLLTRPPDPARPSATPYVLVGAFGGALVGGLLAASFESDFCSTPSTGTTCTGNATAQGVVIGAGVGALAAWLYWSMRRPAGATSASLAETTPQ
jgi:hypothetical protein